MHFSGMYEGEITGRIYDAAILRRFVAYVRPHATLVGAALFLLPVTAGTKLLQPWLVKVAIDRHIVTGDLAGLPLVAATFLAVVLGESLLLYAGILILQTVGQKVMATVRAQIFAHLQRLSSGFFDRNPTGAVVTRATSDVEAVGELFTSGVVTVVGDLLLLAGIVGILLWMNVRLSLAAFSVIPLLVFIVFHFRRRMRQAFRNVRKTLAALNASLAETMGGMAVIHLFATEEREKEKFGRLNLEYRNANLPVINWDASLYALVETLSSVAIGIILWYGGGEILHSHLTFGELVAFISYTEKFFDPIRDLSGKYTVAQGAMASLERIFGLLDTPVSVPDATRPVEPGPMKELEFRDVRFGYQPGDDILRGISFTLKKGERLAIVGETGGGKTTITKLLARLYDVDQGQILLNGTDIRSIPVTSLRRKLGIVLQEPFLLTGTVAYNITLGDADAAARMQAAARAVGADRFIDRLPGGYDEPVRERGANFSAGERQLLSFARALAFDPEILVLDEATSSVDPESERLIRQGLAALLAGRTSVVVAHRLSTIRDADRIIVIHHGEKREEGTHAELMAREGIYRRLYRLQFREEGE